MTIWKGKSDIYLIAEIGGNHEGDFDKAKKLTLLACHSGVDAVKFQIYTGDSLVSSVENPQRNHHFKKFELAREQYLELASLCKANDVVFSASVWDMDAIDWIDPYLDFYKIGSGDLTAYPIIKKIAGTGKPIILSTGLSTWEEIKETVHYIQSIDPRYKKREFLALLQCTSMYPIPDRDANLKVIELFSKKLQLTTGYSDHTTDYIAVEIAVAMGAEIIEFHFTDTRENQTFRDHLISYTPKEVQELIERIRKIKILQGTAQKKPTISEMESNHVTSFRRAVYSKRDLPQGTIIEETHLIFLRPNHGIDARQYEQLIGKRVKRNIQALSALNWEDFD